MAELADALDLGSSVYGRGGSSPPSRTARYSSGPRRRAPRRPWVVRRLAFAAQSECAERNGRRADVDRVVADDRGTDGPSITPPAHVAQIGVAVTTGERTALQGIAGTEDSVEPDGIVRSENAVGGQVCRVEPRERSADIAAHQHMCLLIKWDGVGRELLDADAGVENVVVVVVLHDDARVRGHGDGAVSHTGCERRCELEQP